MLVKTFLKVICVSTLGAGVMLGGALQALSQSALQDPGYGLHRLQDSKKNKKEKSESGLTFSRNELAYWERTQKKLTEKYEREVFEVMSGKKAPDRAMTTLRVFYARTPYYEPFGGNIVKKMTAYAYTADVSEDQNEVNEALKSYRKLLFEHLANIDVVDYALMLSRANPIYGNKLRLEKIYEALMKDIKRGKNKGLDPDDAFIIVTYGEETYLLADHNVTVNKSEIYKVENKFYNVHDVFYEDQSPAQLYFDVTWPIYMYEKTKALRDKDSDFLIPAQ